MRATHVISAISACLLVFGGTTACSDVSARVEPEREIAAGSVTPTFTPDEGHTALHRRHHSPQPLPMSDSLVRKIVNGFAMYNYYDRPSRDTLRFNLFSPRPVEPGRIYPIVLFIADGSTVGLPRREPVRRSLGALAWADPDFQRRNPCYVLVPQFSDMAVNGKWQVSSEVNMTVRMLRSVLQNWQIDESRVYVTGQSMGGMVAMYLASEYPDLFAASLFVACDWDPASYQRLVNIPFVYIAAAGDRKSCEGQNALLKALTGKGVRSVSSEWSVSLSQAMQDTLATQLLDHGEKHFFITLEGVAPDPHHDTFTKAYALTPVLDWVMTQHTLGF